MHTKDYTIERTMKVIHHHHMTSLSYIHMAHVTWNSESDYDEHGFFSATNAVESDDGQRWEPCLQRNFTVRSSPDQGNETYGNVKTETDAENEKNCWRSKLVGARRCYTSYLTREEKSEDLRWASNVISDKTVLSLVLMPEHCEPLNLFYLSAGVCVWCITPYTCSKLLYLNSYLI